MRKSLLLAFVGMVFLGYGSLYAQPPGYSSDTDTGGGDGGGGGSRNVKIALAWGEQLKPPARYERLIVNLREAMARWGGSTPEILGQLRIVSPDLMNLTVLFVSADQAFEINDLEKKNLQSFIAKGGLIVVDDAAANMPNNTSSASLQKMIKAVAGSKRLEPVSSSHEIYKIPNKLGGPPQGSDTAIAIVGKKLGPDGQAYDSGVEANSAGSLQGVTVNGKLAILFCVKGYSQKWSENSDNDPQLKFGVNLITYAMSHKK